MVFDGTKNNEGNLVSCFISRVNGSASAFDDFSGDTQNEVFRGANCHLLPELHRNTGDTGRKLHLHEKCDVACRRSLQRTAIISGVSLFRARVRIRQPDGVLETVAFGCRRASSCGFVKCVACVFAFVFERGLWYGGCDKTGS